MIAKNGKKSHISCVKWSTDWLHEWVSCEERRINTRTLRLVGRIVQFVETVVSQEEILDRQVSGRQVRTMSSHRFVIVGVHIIIIFFIIFVLQQIPGHVTACQSTSRSTSTSLLSAYLRVISNVRVCHVNCKAEETLFSVKITKTSCAARWPPQYTPAPWPWLLTFWPWSRCGSRMWPGVPLAKFRLPRPFGFRVRADVRDIRQTDGRRTPMTA